MVYKIGDFCKSNISSYSAKEKWDEIHYLDTGNITAGMIADIQRLVPGVDNVPSRAKRKVQVNDIIYSTVRPNQCHYGIIKKYDPKMLVSTGFAVITVDPKVADADYIYYFLTQREVVETLHAIGEQSTSAYPSIKPSDIEELEIDLPDLKTQRSVAIVLSALDEKIAVNDKINDNLQQQAHAIFRAWFIDTPESAEWLRGTFSDLIDHTISGDWGKESSTGNYTEMVYCIRGADIPEVKAGNKGKMPTRFILPKNFSAKKLVAGDIVVEISGGSPTQSTGRAAPVSESLLSRYDRGMVCTNFCKAIKPKQGYSMFTYHYWQHLYDAGVFFSYENGTTGIKNLDINGFIETEEIVIPPFEIVEKFDAVCQSIADKVYANGLENERLANLRDALLTRLMSGEIDVSAVQI